MESKLLKWMNLIAFVAMVTINILSDTIPIGHGTNGDISAKYQTLFTPAGYTFSIWGIIYIFMFFFVLMQLEIKRDVRNRALRKRVSGYFVASCLFNIAWIFCWHYEKIGSSLICIIGLLICLGIIGNQINLMGRCDVKRRIVRIGFDVYYGWILVATIANLSVWLSSAGWRGYGTDHQFWMIVAIYVTAFIGLMEIFGNGRPMMGVALIWSFIGIAVQHGSLDGFDYQYPLIFVSTIFAIAMLSIGVLVKGMQERQKRLGRKDRILQN